jgi:hypothetical protein
MPDILDRTVTTPAGQAPVVPVMLMVFGAYLCWFGVHYWRSDTTFPTDPLKAVLTGQEIPVPDRSAGTAAIHEIVSSAGGSPALNPADFDRTAPNTSTLSKDQIKKLWTDNGGSAATANLAAAVAMAESSGRTGVPSQNPDGGTNVGLWQLDTKGVGAGYTVQQLQDPQTNARVTIMATQNGVNWSRWEAYTKGAYKQYL